MQFSYSPTSFNRTPRRSVHGRSIAYDIQCNQCERKLFHSTLHGPEYATMHVGDSLRATEYWELHTALSIPRCVWITDIGLFCLDNYTSTWNKIPLLSMFKVRFEASHSFIVILFNFYHKLVPYLNNMPLSITELGHVTKTLDWIALEQMCEEAVCYNYYGVNSVVDQMWLTAINSYTSQSSTPTQVSHQLLHKSVINSYTSQSSTPIQVCHQSHTRDFEFCHQFPHKTAINSHTRLLSARWFNVTLWTTLSLLTWWVFKQCQQHKNNTSHHINDVQPDTVHSPVQMNKH